MPLEPLPETREVLASLSPSSDHDLLAGLEGQGRKVRALVPSCVGLSLTMVADGLTFTLVASPDEVAVLDAVQFAVGGPCEDAVARDARITAGDADGLLAEKRWTLFARAGAATGVRSTLSLPVHDHGRVVGGVNLYAADPRAFDGDQESVAAVMGAWAPGAIRDADLGFATRDTARRAPRLLDDQNDVAQATGVVMAAQGVDRATARRLIADAAFRSRCDEAAVARSILGSDGAPAA